MMDTEDQLRFAHNQVKELKLEVKRLKDLLIGKDIIKNSLSSTSFDRLKSSNRNKYK